MQAAMLVQSPHPPPIPVGIVGVSGYTGEELLRLIGRHTHFELTYAAARSTAGRPLSTLFPFYKGDVVVETPDPAKAQAACEVLFLALPHKEAMTFVAHLDLTQVKVVDLSADFRLKSKALYEDTYKETHQCPELLSEAVYGLSEHAKQDIAAARLVANPGCYPTCAALGLIPLLPFINLQQLIIVDAKSGVSGAGKKLDVSYLYNECAESIRPYGVVGHRHTPEIEQVLSQAAGQEVRVSFTPHLLPIVRGMLCTSYVTLKPDIDEDQIRKTLEFTYKDQPFVRVLPPGDWPDVRRVVRTNLCLINATVDGRNGLLKVMSSIDNLTKGASGQALQNANLMFGLPEWEGLK